MKNEKNLRRLQYWMLIILFSIGPTLLLHILVKPLWKGKNESNITVTEIESMLTMFFLPVYLALFNYFLSKKYQIRPLMFLINIAIVLFCVWLSAYLHFENWANSIGDKLHPDNDTMEVIGFERSVGYIVSSVGLLIGFFRLKNQNKDLIKTK